MFKTNEIMIYFIWFVMNVDAQKIKKTCFCVVI